MRRAKLDLGIAAMMSPQFDGGPSLDADRRLLLKGVFPTEPNRIVFELSFEADDGQWKIHAVSISTSPARTAADPSAGGPVR